MDATTKASRAVLAEFARKTLRPYEIAGIGLFVVGLIGTAWLISSISAWWWLLMIVVIGYGLIGSIAWLVLHFTIDKIKPSQTAEQAHAVKQFIVKVDKVADTIGLTRFALILRIVGDVMGRRDRNVLSEFADDSMALKDEFKAVINVFR